jgi:hypothetical protein
VEALSENDALSGDEIVLLVEALDKLIPFPEDTAHAEKAEVRFVWMPYTRLRRRLKEAVRMSFYDRARGWLDSELRRERIALTDKLHSRLAELMRDPKATRRTVREGFVAAIRELREERQSPPRPLS